MPQQRGGINVGKHQTGAATSLPPEQRPENPPFTSVRAPVDREVPGQVLDELVSLSVAGAAEEEEIQGEAKVLIQEESESGSLISTAGENSSYYSANSFVEEAKTAIELEEERVGVLGHSQLESAGGEEEAVAGGEQMQKLVFGSLSTHLATKPEFKSDPATPLLEELNADRKRGRTPKSKSEPKKRKVLKEETVGSRRSSRRLSTLVSKFASSPHFQVEISEGCVGDGSGRMNSSVDHSQMMSIKEQYIGEEKQKVEGSVFPTKAYDKGDTTVGYGGDVVVAGIRDEEVIEEEVACKESRKEVKFHRNKGGSREGINSAAITPKRKPTIVDEMVPKSSGKKRRRCLFGEDCQGCKAPECGECKHCLDK